MDGCECRHQLLSDYHVYRWETSDGVNFLVLSFKVAANGTETWNSSSWSQGLKD
ncbi:MAG: hypothetical protein IJN83_07200 [Clostridia bacterium]|nr:hypothetical protein [Clostridia bacterium]